MGSIESFYSFHNIIDGKPRGAKQTYCGIDPTTGKDLWDAPVASKQDVEDAVAAARKAFKPWGKTPFEERVKVLRKFADAVKPYLDDFTELILKENGKPVSAPPLKFAQSEVHLSVLLELILCQRNFASGEAHMAGGDAFDFYRRFTEWPMFHGESS